MKMGNDISEIAKELFRRNCITKVELEKFLAEEQAFEKLYNYNLDKIKKREEIELKRLTIYRNQIQIYSNIVAKLAKMSQVKKDIFLSNSTDQLLKQIDNITENILESFGSFLPTEIKNKIESRG